LEFRSPPRDLKAYPSTQAPDFTYVPLGYKTIDAQSALVCTYPSGLSLLILASAKLSSWDNGPALMFWAHALAGVLLTWILARQAQLSALIALFAAASVGLSPVYLSNSVQLMSDIPSLTWLTATLVCGLHLRRPYSSALLSGFAFGVAVLVRPTNALVLPALLLALSSPRTPATPWRWLLFVLGGLPCAASLLFLNKLEFGSYFTSGYGNIGYLLSPRHIPGALQAYALWIPCCLFPLAPLALLAPRFTSPRPHLSAVLSLWILSFSTFYAFYRHTGEHWYYLRFLIPVTPALVVLALSSAAAALPQIPNPRTRTLLASIGITITLVTLLIADHRLQVLSSGASERTYTQACQEAKRRLPPNAVVLAMQCSGALRYHTNFVIARWDILNPETFSKLHQAAIAESRPLYALLFRFESEEALHHHAPASWTLILEQGDIQLYQLAQSQSTTALRPPKPSLSD